MENGMPKLAILITGSKGLIGNALKIQLNHRETQTRGIDCAFDISHMEHGNIQDKASLARLAEQCYGIVHLAGVSRVITGEQNPTLCWKTNVEGTQTILETAWNLPHRPWVIYASSREVYGQQTCLPVSEDASLLPVNIYARSKVAAEQLIAQYRIRGLQTATLRFSNVYGTTTDYHDRVIPAFCKTAALGGVLRVDGGDNIFDFTYIDDVVAGILLVIDKLQEKCFDLPTLHFTTGQGTSLHTAASLAQKYSPHALSILHAPSRSFDVGTFYGNPQQAKQLLNWQAKIPLAQGMQQLIHAFQAGLIQ
jgi:nucleoside-diphosphate-sugar epimerase